jgi:acyl-CoA thioesterase-1|tara:strand:- start:5974 stop:6609 length:636 start_codon:yes stop_codon:yes gene_type:complete
MRLTRLCILCLSCSIYFSSWAADEDITLLVYGDSLSAFYGIEQEQGWVNLLKSKLRSEKLPVDVVNGSVSGETTTGGLARLPAMLDSYQPELLILELGGNDGLRGLPLDLMRENLASMIDLAKASGAEVILTGIQIPPNYGPRYTAPFFEIYSALAKQKLLPLVPFLIDGIPQQPELMQNDGIHPRAEAQSMILDNVWLILKPQLEILLKK